MEIEKNASPEEKHACLLEISQEVSACKKCALHQTRKKSVPGTGPDTAEIMLIGEGPGFHENEQGLPFVGAAGKFLDELLAGINLKRADVFITNVVKCRPPGNRDPEPDELNACNAYLERQIAALDPKVIVTLGRFSMAKFIPNVKITQVHGKARMVNGRLVVPMFHPAAALHQGSLRPLLEEDFKRLPEMIAKPAPAKLGPAKTTPVSVPNPQMSFDPPAVQESETAPQTSTEPPKAPADPVQLTLF